jgi:TRAP-type uncharacterized transport system substrate-binding protein
VRGALAGVTFAILCLMNGSVAGAAGTDSKPNNATLGVLADTPDSFTLLQRLARAMDRDGNLRIVPMAGKGPVQSLTDLVNLRNVDAALIPSDTLAYMEKNGLIDGLTGKIAFVVRLAGLDIHVVARQGLNSLADLGGKTVVTGNTASESFVAGQFLIAGIQPPPKLLAGEDGDAVRAVADGRADAAIVMGRKPLAPLLALGARKGLHFIDVMQPEDLKETYAPALLSHEDYPQLIPAGRQVETVSSSLVIAVFNSKRGSPRYDRIHHLAEVLFVALQHGGDGDAGLNLAAAVPGWNRHAGADAALANMSAKDSKPEN